MRTAWLMLPLLMVLGACSSSRSWSRRYPPLLVPRLESPPVIDGNLSEWKYRAYHDGVWDIFRLQHSPWYNPRAELLEAQNGERRPEPDINARYYMAWDEKYLYLGAEVQDGANDIQDQHQAPQHWYGKDAICWFIEAPRDNTSERFGKGDNGFCFVIDASKPAYGAWWRHGDATRTYIEEPLPPRAVDYAIRLNPWHRSPGDFILEARVEMMATLKVSNPDWRPPKPGDEYGIEIVESDPDAGDFGKHFLVYGNGDDDATWGRMKLIGPIQPVVRRPE